MTRLVFLNETDYPDDEVKALVRFAVSECEYPDDNQIVVRVRHTRISKRRHEAGARYMYGASGKAYYWRRYIDGVLSWEMVLRISRPEIFPVDWHDRGYAGPSGVIGLLKHWKEALVAIAAHEGKHIEDYQHGRRYRPHRDSEGRCDAYAAKMTKVYRGLQS